jgi:hypothetical protein
VAHDARKMRIERLSVFTNLIYVDRVDTIIDVIVLQDGLGD